MAWRAPHLLMYLAFLSTLPLTHGVKDWFLEKSPSPVTLTPFTTGSLSGSTLSNGLLSLTFVTSINSTLLLWDYQTYLDQPSGESLLRAFSAEAILTCGGGCDARPSSPPPFTKVATDSAAMGGDCTFVGQGNQTGTLEDCTDSCWATAGCTTVNWGPASQPDCVLRKCTDPFSPSLSPYPGFTVYSALIPSATARLGGVVASPSIPGPITTGPYLNRTGLDFPGSLLPDSTSPFTFAGTLAQLTMDTPFAWTPGVRGSDPTLPWPPPGIHIAATFLGVPGTPWQGVNATIHYQVFQGMPLVGKWVEVGCSSATPPCNVTLDGVEVVDLALNPGFSPLATQAYAGQSEDFAGGSPVYPGTGRLTPITSLQYGTHARHTNDVITLGGDAGSTQPRLLVGDDAGLGVPLAAPSPPWVSVKLYLMLHDEGFEQGVTIPLYPASETYWGCTLGPCAVPGSGTPFEGSFSERRGLSLRRFLLAVAPQVAEAPLQYHLAVSDSGSVRAACDQMASVGWEMLVLSYGSGYDVESSDPVYIARVASDVAYCKGKGIEVGGYDLIGWTRDPGRGWAALDSGGHDTGNACFASGWEDFFQEAVLSFSAATGATVLESDGPYAGYACSNASHAHHSGAGNSVQIQSRRMARVYTALRDAGIHVNAPDSWFTAGSNKMGIGYNEGTSRLPRHKSAPIYRGVIYDATMYTLPSASWSYLPLTGCGGSECEYEPLSQNLGDFELAMAQHLAMGISAFLYQGTTMYDSPEGQALYVKWGGFFKAHRQLLSTGDLIHVKRVDGQGLDAVLHAKAGQGVPGLLVIFNPSDALVNNGTLLFPAYYTGIEGVANVLMEPWPTGDEGGGGGAVAAVGAPISVPLDVRGRGVLTGISIPPRSLTWATLTQG